MKAANEKLLVLVMIFLGILLGVLLGIIMSNGRGSESVHKVPATRTVVFPIEVIIEDGTTETTVKGTIKMPVDQVVNVPVTGEPA